MLMEPLILIVDDENSIRKFLRVSIETQGYKCIDADNGSNAIMLTISQNPDILILDLGLPDMDGVDVIKKLRTMSQIPIIIISARGHDREKVEALDAGADDYLTKPFSVTELLARIRVILRHKSINEIHTEKENEIFKINNLIIDTDKHRIWIEDEEVRLTPNEYKVLVLLAKNHGKVLTHKFITDNVWGSTGIDDTQSLRVCMGNLRRKLGEDPAQPKYIITEIGVGYRLIDEQ
ncbi:KDP operon transcriptional regulatory protein KdpE [bioreactor metagenome]|uniref:KDP operon transcriptional regulatory protein KdpE n=1 Tax=bioreactor metagenome TaxID=1076179 RepID=A0A644WUU0_9ZZZZ|nr:response regulator [Sedimentibacter saalensis]